MNYEKIYFAFVESFKSQEIEDGVYTEVHHILPRYAGGDDSEENLVKVTYPQHVFLHKLWAKLTGDPQAILAYKLMSSLDVERKIEICRMAGTIAGRKNVESGHISALGKLQGPISGKRNVESGLLDQIRPLANNEAQREWAKRFGEEKRDSGFLDEIRKLANEAWRGSSHTEEYKEEKSKLYKEWYTSGDPKWAAAAKKRGVAAGVKKAEESRQRSLEVIENAERNEEYLQKSSYRSKNIFVSPEGLEFDGPENAAKYYGNVEPYTVDNWCKRAQHGWYRKPKISELAGEG